MYSDGDTSDFEAVSGFAQRIGSLGSATESFFEQIYNLLTRRKELSQTKSRARHLERQRQELVTIAERREKELSRLHGIMTSLDDGIVMQDRKGRVVFMNQAAKDMLGGQKGFRESALSQIFDEYKDVDDTPSEVTPLGEPTRLQINNRILGATLAAVTDSDGARIGTLTVLRDVTEEALGERLKDNFVTAISHELRTPMNVIKMSTEVLAGAPEDAPANRRMLEMIGRNVDVLDRMIVELLDISEITSGTFEVRQDVVNLEKLAWNVVQGLTPEIKRSGMDVSVMTQDLSKLQARGDAERLRWALGHLIQNSIHFSEQGSIMIAISLANDENIAIQVIDTGVGIAEKDLPHIFDRFYRGEARTPDGKLLDPRGLGQGLFVARTVAEAHDGYLSVHSTPGQGSVFTMVIPRAQNIPPM